MWKQFRNYNYEASSSGEIRNILTGRVLKQRQEKEGYLLIDIKIPGNNPQDKKINKTFRCHRIVAETFFGNRERGWEVDHINKLRNDNRSENLRWVDKSQNSSDRILCGIIKEEIEEIVKLYNMGDTIQQIYLKINKKILS